MGGGAVETRQMPASARIFMLMMMMGMTVIGLMVVLHFVAAANVGSWSAQSVAASAISLEGFRRLGVAMYLFGIAFGLGTIVTVLAFPDREVARARRSLMPRDIVREKKVTFFGRSLQARLGHLPKYPRCG